MTGPYSNSYYENVDSLPSIQIPLLLLILQFKSKFHCSRYVVFSTSSVSQKVHGRNSNFKDLKRFVRNTTQLEEAQ